MMTEAEREAELAWNKLKYACEDIGGSHVVLKVSIGQFKRVVKESFQRAEQRGQDNYFQERKELIDLINIILEYGGLPSGWIEKAMKFERGRGAMTAKITDKDRERAKEALEGGE